MSKPINTKKIIHASSIEMSGKGVVIFGKSGVGKSNLAIKLISMGANLIADDQTQLDLKEDKILISKYSSTPNFIEARGIGFIKVPFKMNSELFCFIKITNLELPRLPNEKTICCFGKKIKVLEYNPYYSNECALFLGLRYGVKLDPV